MKRLELKIARIKKELKQREIAVYLGISTQEYSKIENGRNISLEQAKMLARVLNININSI
jgi:transcriptional regulator with XRE-family HTH domain